MSRLGILGATALSISLAVAAPAFAQHVRGGGGTRIGGGNFGAMRAGAATFGGAQANFRGAQASLGGANISARPGGAQIAQGGLSRFFYACDLVRPTLLFAGGTLGRRSRST